MIYRKISLILKKIEKKTYRKKNLPVNVTLTCIKPIWVPMRAGNFSRENALYGAIIVVCATCHAEPSLVTT